MIFRESKGIDNEIIRTNNRLGKVVDTRSAYGNQLGFYTLVIKKLTMK